MKKRLILALVLLVNLWGCTPDVKQEVQKQDEKPMQSQNITSSEKTSQAITTKPQECIVPEDAVVIALLDTGVSRTAIVSAHLLAGYNYVTNTLDTEDYINHGTAVTSVILGCESAGVPATAQDAYVVPLVVVTKLESEMVSVSPEVLAQAIKDSVDVYGADIINVSLGIQKEDEALRQAITYAEENNVLIVSAVGNGGQEGKAYYPAAYDSVLAVGACDEHGQESDFSQSGSDILAPGEDIWLASKNGMTYGVRGTSFATGFVSAAAANLLIAEPELSSQNLREKIIENAKGYGGCLP